MSLHRVTLPDSPDAYATWDILPRLTDERGELQDDAMDSRAFHELLKDKAHLQRLQSELDGVFGRVAVMDGTFGVLYEAVLPCRGRQVAKGRCIAFLLAMKQQVPTLEVAIGPEWVNELAAGVCLWLFAREGSLTPQQRAKVVGELHQAGLAPPQFALAA